MEIKEEEFMGFLYGTLLGDSYLHNGSFCCVQISKDLMEFKRKMFEKFMPEVKISYRVIPASVKNGVTRQETYSMWISGSPLFAKLQQKFYPNGKKIIPEGIFKELGPLGFAMLYADDGTTVLVQAPGGNQSSKNRRIQICTDCFSLEEQERMRNELKDLGYETSLSKRGLLYRLNIKIVTGIKLLEMIEPYFYEFFPSLLYKIDVGYRGESLKNRRYVSETYEKTFYKISAHPLFKNRCK